MNQAIKSAASPGSNNVGTGPKCVAFDGSCIWVANCLSNNVSKMTAATGAVIGTYSCLTNPYGIAFDGVHVWVGVGSAPTGLGTFNVRKL